MAITPKIKELVTLALSDRVLTNTERHTIVAAAMQDGIAETEINEYINSALRIRLQSYTKEQLQHCPFCGAQTPLVSDECLFCGKPLNNNMQPSGATTPPPFIQSREADIIRGENLRTAQQSHDVKNYLLRYDQEIEHTKRQKSQILKRFTTGVIVFFAILIMVIFIAFVGIILE